MIYAIDFQFFFFCYESSARCYTIFQLKMFETVSIQVWLCNSRFKYLDAIDSEWIVLHYFKSILQCVASKYHKYPQNIIQSMWKMRQFSYLIASWSVWLSFYWAKPIHLMSVRRVYFTVHRSAFVVLFMKLLFGKHQNWRNLSIVLAIQFKQVSSSNKIWLNFENLILLIVCVRV